MKFTTYTAFVSLYTLFSASQSFAAEAGMVKLDPTLDNLFADGESAIESGYESNLKVVSDAATGNILTYKLDADKKLVPVYYEYTYTPTAVSHEKVDTSVGNENLQGHFIGLADGGAVYIPFKVPTPNIISIRGDFMDNSYTKPWESGYFAGAITNAANIGSIVGDFINNTSSMSGSLSSNPSINGKNGVGYGGAIHNRLTIGSITGNFIKNNSKSVAADANGGAIANQGSIDKINGDFVANRATADTLSAKGGAIYGANNGKIGILNSNFIDNHAIGGKNASGGAFFNEGKVTEINGDFINNSSEAKNDSRGGAISNYGDSVSIATIGKINSSFWGNSVKSQTYIAYGGAIYNNGNISEGIVGDFVQNSAEGLYAYGGAIYNEKNIGKLDGGFYGNKSSSTSSSSVGGAIYNEGSISEGIKGLFYENEAKSNTGNAFGGAIYNDAVAAKIATIDADFVNNKVSGNAAYAAAIYNKGTIGALNGGFYKNSAQAKNGSAMGGAIYNTGNFSGGIKGNFEENVANSDAGSAYGGAVYNSSGAATIATIDGDFLGNKVSGGAAYGAALYNAGTIGAINGDFNQNSIEARTGNAMGGAIYNSGTFSGGIKGNFSENSITKSLSAYGAALANDGTIKSLEGDFLKNTIVATKNGVGAAIYNTGTISGVVKSSFSENSINAVNAYGAGIYNTGTMEAIEGGFVKNSIVAANAYGAAIYNKTAGVIKKIVGNFSGNNISATSLAYGAAIYNNNIISEIEGNFVGNEAKAPVVLGGAISNMAGGYTPEITGNFSENYANADEYAKGGAIYNEFTSLANGKKVLFGDQEKVFWSKDATVSPLVMNVKNSTFFGNKVLAKEGVALGGAIYNSSSHTMTDEVYASQENFDKANNAYENDANFAGSLEDTGALKSMELLNVNFVNNEATSVNGEAKGGAIYSDIDVKMIADKKDILMSGNKANNKSNAIYMARRKIVDSVSGDDIAVANPTLTLQANQGSSITIDDGIDGDNGYKVAILSQDNGVVNLNGQISNAEIVHGDMPVQGISLMSADAGFVTNVASGDLLNGNNSMIINAGTVNILDLSLSELHFNTLNLNGGVMNIDNVNVDLAEQKMGSISADKYDVKNGTLNVKSVKILSDAKDENSFITFAHNNLIKDNLISGVENSRGPVHLYDVDYDKNTGKFAFAKRGYNPAVTTPSASALAAVAVLSDEIYSRVLSDVDASTMYQKPQCCRNISNAWVKTFTADDDVSIKNYGTTDARYSGVIAGMSSMPIDEGKNWSGVYNLYVAYADGKQEYAEDENRQKSWYMGLGQTLYNGDFYAGATANIGLIKNVADVSDGRDKFNSYVAGFAFKTGYNYHLYNLIFQPNLYGSYTMINSEDYTTSGGAKMDFGSLYTTEIAPGIKIMANVGSNTNVYSKLRYVWTFNNGQDVKANEILLPELSLKSYVEYGAGLEKDFDGLNTFVEVTRRDGGRSGWNGILGVKYNF